MRDDGDREQGPDHDFEHGWEALAGLDGRMSVRLKGMRGADGYAPVGPWDVVPVEPCPFCADGGLRTAGYVTRDQKLLPVRQCDTCHALEIGATFYPGDEYDGPDDEGADEGDEDEDEGGDGPRDGRWSSR